MAPAGPLIGIGPAAVEDVFSLRMRFQIARHDAGDGAVEPGHQMARSPAGARAGRAGDFQGRKKCMRDEWVIAESGTGAGALFAIGNTQRVKAAQTGSLSRRITAAIP